METGVKISEKFFISSTEVVNRSHDPAEELVALIDRGPVRGCKCNSCVSCQNTGCNKT